MLCHQTNVKVSNFCYLKLCIKNKFIDQPVNNIVVGLSEIVGRVVSCHTMAQRF